MSDAEHRFAKRVPLDLLVQFRRNGQVFDGSVVNCSISGLFLRTSQKLEEHDILEITIPLPGIDEPIRLTSMVVWTDWNEQKQHPGFGIHFVSLTDEQAHLLRSYLYDQD